MEQPIPFRGQITQEVYEITQSMNSRFIYNLGTFIPILMAGYGIILFALNRDLESLAYPLGTAVVIFLLRGYIRKVQMRLMYNNTSYDEFILQGEFNDDGLVLKDDQFQMEVRWDEMARYRTGPGVMLLFRKVPRIHVMHRSFFASPEAWEAFQQLVRSKIAKGE